MTATVQPPRASVLMLTYNHAAFVEEALRSVFAQRCDFPFEIVLGDDASTDGTLGKAYELQRERPELLRVLPSERNMGVTHNFLRSLQACRGEYIALFDGDDYWLDERKLQCQVDQLEKDRTLAMSACRTRNRQFWAKPEKRYSLAELLRRYIFHTSALVFRRVDMARYPAIPRCLSWDTLLIAHLGTFGDCGFIDREMTYYRRHADGIWTGAALARRLVDAQSATDALSRYFEGWRDAELFDRELWIYRMMLEPDPARPILRQWWERRVLAWPLLTRTFRRRPLGSLASLVCLLLWPARAGFARARLRLGLRTRLARWRTAQKSGA